MKRFLNMPTLTLAFTVLNMGKLSYECMFAGDVSDGMKLAVVLTFGFVCFVLGLCVAFDAGRDFP